MLRLDAEQFGAPRAAVLAALQAEGIPCTAGYGFSLHEQPMFQTKSFGPYLHEQRDQLNYQNAKVPNSDRLCKEQAIWLEQGMFLGPREDVEDIARAFEKVYEGRAALAEWAQRFARNVIPPGGNTMAIAESRVTIHMAASLDGFIARQDGSVDWMETTDEFVDGATMDPAFVEAFLNSIDCYVMGSRTYETALGFEAQGHGWAYGDKPTFVLTSRELPSDP